jgi:DNA-directed RNA polymerase sigma subunit (sigma70/sigma32)
VNRAASALERSPDAERLLDARTYEVLRLRATGYTLKHTGQLLERRFHYSLSASRVREIELEAVARLVRIGTNNTPEGFYRFERFGP